MTSDKKTKDEDTTKKSSKRLILEQSVAGLSAGSLSTLILHPIDLIKTKLQADDKLKLNRQSTFGRFFATFKVQYKNQGLRSLYLGLTPNLAGSALSWSFYFGWYSLIKQYYARELGDGRIATNLSMSQSIIASTLAGSLTLLFTNPIWVVKTRIFTATDKQAVYTGLLDGLRQIKRKEGVKGLYRGLTPALFGTSHGALQFMVYERLKSLRAKDENLTVLPVFDYLWMATFSKSVAAVVTYPYQVVKTRLQKLSSGPDSRIYTSTLDTIRKIYSYEGLSGFYKGLGPSTLRVLPGTCITFLTYETISNYFRRSI